jgi:hypothetical protein
MPAFLEEKLKREYGADSATPYKVMNAIGAMKGNRETPKGRAMQAKHDRDARNARIAPVAHADVARAAGRGFGALPGVKKVTLGMLMGKKPRGASR